MWIEEVNKSNPFLNSLKPDALEIHKKPNTSYCLEKDVLIRITNSNSEVKEKVIPLEELKLIMDAIELFKEKTIQEPSEYTKTLYSYLDLMLFCLKSMGLSKIKTNYNVIEISSFKSELLLEALISNHSKIVLKKENRRITGTLYFTDPETAEFIF